MHISPEKTIVKIAVKNATEEILFLRRSDEHPLYKGQLDLPGGLSEKNEKPVETVTRELKEETGLVIDSIPTLLFYKKNSYLKRNNKLLSVFRKCWFAR